MRWLQLQEVVALSISVEDFFTGMSQVTSLLVLVLFTLGLIAGLMIGR